MRELLMHWRFAFFAFEKAVALGNKSSRGLSGCLECDFVRLANREHGALRKRTWLPAAEPGLQPSCGAPCEFQQAAAAAAAAATAAAATATTTAAATATTATAAAAAVAAAAAFALPIFGARRPLSAAAAAAAAAAVRGAAERRHAGRHSAAPLPQQASWECRRHSEREHRCCDWAAKPLQR